MKRFGLHKLGSNERGVAVIELALVAPVFALMAIGIVDMSNAFSRKLALEQGAQRAIEKIMQTTGDNTVEGTLASEAVCQVNGTNANGSCKTSPITASDVTVTFRLECVNSAGAITTHTNSDSTALDAINCPSSDRRRRYIQVALVDRYVPVFPIHFSGYDSTTGSYRITAAAGMRTE